MKNFIYQKQTSEALDQEFQQAVKYGKIKLGKDHLFWKKGLKWYVVPLDDAERAYRRVEGVNAKMCCGRADFDIQKLVLLLKDGSRLELLIGDAMPKEAERLFEQLKATRPNMLFGKV